MDPMVRGDYIGEQIAKIHEACGARGVKIEGKIEGDAGLYSL
jgi:hypothetical protein